MTGARRSRIAPIECAAAWDARTLRDDPSWIVPLSVAQQAEIVAALAHFKEAARRRGLTAQWLHGHMVPTPQDFPLPTLAPLLAQAQRDLEEKYGLILFKGFPVDDLSLKDLHLAHAGLAGHVGRLRPQTVFGEMVQDIRDSGQAALIERRGSKHNRALSFHNDPSDVVGFLCVQPSPSGGDSLFCSSLAIHNALARTAPQHVRTLYGDFVHTYQDYLFVRTGANERFLPRRRFYSMPLFTAAQGRFACKYSRFYIDQAQELPEVPRLTPAQREALDAFERELADERWQLRLRYERGDAMFINNFVCFHARTAFDDGDAPVERRRHLLRLWLSQPNSRPLAASWKRQVFFRATSAGTPRGGVPIREPAYG